MNANLDEKIDILYIHRAVTDASAGDAIYDKRFIEATRALGYKVSLAPIETTRKLSFPIWGCTYSDYSAIEKIVELSRRSRHVIVSHEQLSFLCDYLEPTLFIIHNYMPAFCFLGRPDITLLYRTCAQKPFERIFERSRNCLLISHRDYRHASKDFPLSSTLLEPPGIYAQEYSLDFDFEKIKRHGSTNWPPKKISLYPDRQWKKLCNRHGFKTVTDQNHLRSFSLIEEKFLIGFKLKLLDQMFRGDVIASLCDLKEELMWLNLDTSNFFYSRDLQSAFDKFLIARKDGAILTKNELVEQRKIMKERYSWTVIAERIFTQLNMEPASELTKTNILI